MHWTARRRLISASLVLSAASASVVVAGEDPAGVAGDEDVLLSDDGPTIPTETISGIDLGALGYGQAVSFKLNSATKKDARNADFVMFSIGNCTTLVAPRTPAIAEPVDTTTGPCRP